MIPEHRIALNKEVKYKEYLFLINGLLNLTRKEIEILSEFIKVMFETNETENIFSTEIRKIVAERFDIKNVHTYVKSFVDKGLVSKRGDNYYPKKILMPTEVGITFKFKWLD